MGLLLMSVFVMKMLICIAPAFLRLDNKTVSAAVNQLEEETKAEKDSTDKASFKDKLDELDKHFTPYAFEYVPMVTEINRLHRQEQLIHHQDHLPVIPTPPPNCA